MEISRDLYLGKLIKRKHNGSIKVITGIRRCGKSYLLNTIFYRHLLESGVAENHIVRFAFDSADDLARIGENLIQMEREKRGVDPEKFMDYMRKNFDAMKVERQAHYLNSDDDNFLDKNDNTEGGDLGIELEKSELLALQNSMLLDLYESVRKDFSPRACVAFEMVKLQGIPVREVSKELGMIPSDISQCIFKISKALKDTVIKHEIYKELKENDRSK